MKSDDILDDIRNVIQECKEELLIELDKRMENKDSIDYERLKNMF
jgi:hypothetical protein